MKYLKGHIECLEKTIVLCFLKCCSFSLQKCLEELWDLFYNDNVQFEAVKFILSLLLIFVSMYL